MPVYDQALFKVYLGLPMRTAVACLSQVSGRHLRVKIYQSNTTVPGQNELLRGIEATPFFIRENRGERGVPADTVREDRGNLSCDGRQFNFAMRVGRVDETLYPSVKQHL